MRGFGFFFNVGPDLKLVTYCIFWIYIEIIGG